MSETSLQEAITLSFKVDGLPPSPNQMKGAHWSKIEKNKKFWMAKIHYAALDAKNKEGLRGTYDNARIHVHISTGDNRRHDPDNLIWSVCKPLLDSLTGLLIVDDNIDQIQLGFSFDRLKPKGFRVTLTGR